MQLPDGTLLLSIKGGLIEQASASIDLQSTVVVVIDKDYIAIEGSPRIYTLKTDNAFMEVPTPFKDIVTREIRQKITEQRKKGHIKQVKVMSVKEGISRIHRTINTAAKTLKVHPNIIRYCLITGYEHEGIAVKRYSGPLTKKKKKRNE